MEILDGYLEHLRRLQRSPETIKLRRTVLRRLSADLPYGLAATTTAELGAWLFEADLKPNSIATYGAAIRDFYAWAANVRDPWLSFNPALDLEETRSTKGVARPITDEQLAAILSSPNREIRRWATIGAYQGLRCVEVSRLDREHVTEQQLFVVKGKGGQPRVHDTDPAVWDAVKDLPPGPIARTISHGDRASASYVSVWASHHFQHELGLAGVTMHRLRHWLGVTLQRRYRNIRVTQAALGHTSLSSTQIYTSADDSELRAARATLPRFGA